MKRLNTHHKQVLAALLPGQRADLDLATHLPLTLRQLRAALRGLVAAECVERVPALPGYTLTPKGDLLAKAYRRRERSDLRP